MQRLRIIFLLTFLILVIAASLMIGFVVATTNDAQSANALQTTSRAPSLTAVDQALTLPFPRLGMWWPNPWEQSLDDIARYDWVILGDWAAEFIAPLKARNADIMLLSSTNACELAFNADPNAEPWENEDVLAIPPEWFLTQVGTTLTQAVDASTTTFYVNDLAVSDANDSYPLFVVGDTVLIEGESVLVQAIDDVNNALTVQRGYVRPAAPHATGVRIAAHITFWPNSWLLNLSTLSPTAVISATIGPERWGDYNARASADLLSNPGWDGLLIDRADPNQSWLVGGSTARTIDPDQSNTLPADYSDFDAAWNDGLRQYESQLRQEIGDEKILFVNWGMDNYDLLNGNNYEAFPHDDGTSYRESWQQTVFGALPDTGSYFDWIEEGQQPNLTMIETYEDDSGPPPTSNGEYDNPCDEPDFVPNYKKMRFGLTTALLNDGFFSYEINTNGHGSLCLLWFDEYDNAGAGQGYLGQPLGPAYRVGQNLLGPSLLNGGDFEGQTSLDQWELWADSDAGYAAAVFLDTTTAVSGNSSARIDVTQAQGTDWQVSFFTGPTPVMADTEYTISFWAKADQERPLSAWMQQEQDPWHSYLYMDEVMLTTEWQLIEVVATADGSDPQAGFYFGLGQDTGSVWLDGVRFQEGSRDVWRRNFEGGIALVNATNDLQNIGLGATFQKISGSQDPAVNDGLQVTQVDLPSKDGIVLLRPLTTPLYLPNITITTANTNDIQLSWPHDNAYDSYQVWHDTAPYFQLIDMPYGTVLSAPWEFLDNGARGDIATNHFYWVQGILNDGATLSQQVGEFDFMLSSN